MIEPDFDFISQHTGHNDYLNSLIFKILQLEHQVKNVEDKSWYFKSGIESHRAKLDNLINDYDSLRNSVNSSTIDEVKRLLKRKEKDLSKAENRIWSGSRWMRSMYLSTFRSRIDIIKLHLNIKNDIAEIPKLKFFGER